MPCCACRMPNLPMSGVNWRGRQGVWCSSARANAWNSSRRSAVPEMFQRDLACPAWRVATGLATAEWRPRALLPRMAPTPYTTGRDQCLVHNGSLSNHSGLRRMLVKQGFHFETENDSEVAAAYLSWRMQQGDTLTAALQAGCGIWTGSTPSSSAPAPVLPCCATRCAVNRQLWRKRTTGWRSEANIVHSRICPGIEQARVWEPEPATVYAWDHAA